MIEFEGSDGASRSWENPIDFAGIIWKKALRLGAECQRGGEMMARARWLFESKVCLVFGDWRRWSQGRRSAKQRRRRGTWFGNLVTRFQFLVRFPSILPLFLTKLDNFWARYAKLCFCFISDVIGTYFPSLFRVPWLFFFAGSLPPLFYLADFERINKIYK